MNSKKYFSELTVLGKQNQEKNIMDFITNLNNADKKKTVISGVTGSFAPFAVSKIKAEKKNEPVLVVLSDEMECEKFAQDLRFFNKNLDIRLFTEYKQDLFKSDSLHMETAASRIKTLYDLGLKHFSGVILATATAAAQNIIPVDVLMNSAEIYGINEDIDMSEIVDKLLTAGYSRTSLVEEPGDFAVRGGILDFFSPVYENPVRIEFFGDMIESIRLFSVNSQRKTEDLSEVLLIPVSEVVWQSADIDNILTKIRKKGAASGAPVESVKAVIDKLKTEGNFQGIETLLTLFYSIKQTLFDYLPKDSIIVLNKFARGRENLLTRINSDDQKYFQALDAGLFRLNPKDLFIDPENYGTHLEKFSLFDLREIPISTKEGEEVLIRAEDNTWIKGELKSKVGSDYPLSPLVDWVREKTKKELYPVVVCSTKTQAQRLESALKPYGVVPEIEEEIRVCELVNRSSSKGLLIAIGRLTSGFTFEEGSFALITDDEIFGVKPRRRKKVKKLASERVFSLNELALEDVVVHVDHGLGKYKGLEKIKVGNLTSEFAVVQYRDEDKLYIPVDRINILNKYVGSDNASVNLLDKLGGKDWSKAKEKARKKAEKIAKELLSIYAKREINSGYSFTPVNDSFRDFESSFPYEETPGQINAINDVISDMEKPKPMDRLVCGDVGYGKTEVAVRAAFKAVSDGKQVAILVPTTVLAEQHSKTFEERFQGYPVNIRVLNRFRTKKQQTEILNGMESGEVDIVIGTHRLLQKDIKFQALGLLVIDEEQRFGVKHKERIKGIRSSVDVLTLTATPIPRTLHLSLSGIRDISIISTPPEARQPIISYISEFDDNIIREAILNELSREGQAYFVHNNINTIDSIVEFLEKLLPNIRICKAHGRMPERELENNMKKFIHREAEILVCTTIVESGLDIPGANTMIVNRADRFGLAQLYQLRGRIGRGKNQAYAYLFVPEENRLTKDAAKRLKVLMQYSDLGAGFQLAMGDLQIRGGGDILGASQSGHVSAIGYDLFLKLLENAVSNLKGEDLKETIEPEINAGFSAYIPESYIPDIDQRMIIYRRLTRLSDIRELSGFKKELLDRYGKVPREAENLLIKIMLRILCIKCKIQQLDMGDSAIFVNFSPGFAKKVHAKLGNEVKKRKWMFTGETKLKISPEKGKASIAFAKKSLQVIQERVNGK